MIYVHFSNFNVSYRTHAIWQWCTDLSFHYACDDIRSVTIYGILHLCTCLPTDYGFKRKFKEKKKADGHCQKENIA